MNSSLNIKNPLFSDISDFSADLKKKIFVYNMDLTNGLHNSWIQKLLDNYSSHQFKSQSFLISRQIEKKLNLSDHKCFEYSDSLQLLSILEDDDLHKLLITLGAYALGSTIKCLILNHQVVQLKNVLGLELYSEVLNSEFTFIADVYNFNFLPTSVDIKDLPNADITLNIFLKAACQILAVLFKHQSIFFKKRFSLRLPYDFANVLTEVNVSTLQEDQLVELRNFIFLLLEKVSLQWQKWSK